MQFIEQEKSVMKRRTKGERTRQKILEATISVLAKHGVKGTTHRAIAKTADIQLSLTTYYFKDIEELIYQAIWLNSDVFSSSSDQAWYKVFELLKNYTKADLRKVSTKKLIAEEVTNILTYYSYQKVQERADELAVEQILFTQTHISPSLLVLSQKHRQTLLEPAVRFCRMFNKEGAELDADILLTIIKQTEFCYLSMKDENNSIHMFKEIIGRIIQLVLRIKL